MATSFWTPKKKVWFQHNDDGALGKRQWDKKELDSAFENVVKQPPSEGKTKLLKNIYKARFEE